METTPGITRHDQERKEQTQSQGFSPLTNTETLGKSLMSLVLHFLTNKKRALEKGSQRANILTVTFYEFHVK